MQKSFKLPGTVTLRWRSARLAADEQFEHRCDHFGSADFPLTGDGVGTGQQVALDGNVDPLGPVADLRPAAVHDDLSKTRVASASSRVFISA